MVYSTIARNHQQVAITESPVFLRMKITPFIISLRHHNNSHAFRRQYSSQPSRPTPVADFNFGRIQSEMRRRTPKHIFDYLVPTSSFLLNTALSDHIPGSCQPGAFSENRTLFPVNETAGLLPEGHHLVYFPFQLPASRLAEDGADLDHAPGVPFVRRMWAGGSIRFHHDKKPLILNGDRAVCLEEIGDVALKGDGTGKEKVFVDIWRRYCTAADEGFPSADMIRDHASIEERRTLVFMRPQTEDIRKPIAEAQADNRRSIASRRSSHKEPDFSFKLIPDPFLLFHFSALTYNAHFIHYDRLWAQAREGYHDLLVHGPLSLVLLFTALRPLLRQYLLPQIELLEYRNYGPLFCGQEMTVYVKKGDHKEGDGKEKWSLWIEGPDGNLAVKGSATSVRM
jgi:hydroxyacyl-ACP dehydratase HTD2-like protein with hotdog domain